MKQGAFGRPRSSGILGAIASPSMSVDSCKREEEPVSSTWQSLVRGALVLFLAMAGLVLAHSFWPPASPGVERQALERQALERQILERQMQSLTEQLDDLRQQQAMPSLVLNRYRDSICYIFGVYQVAFAHHPALERTRISGSGFVVGDTLIATNRHVAEPWYGDPDSERLLRKGATPQLEQLEAYFPGLPAPVKVTPAALSTTGDLALLRTGDPAAASLVPLPLAAERPNPGELVAVVGYPMGVLGMMAKAPTAVYARLAIRQDDPGTAGELAALSLIRPSATYGHLGDVVGDKLIYDAPTAHGASGGPVFNSRAEVIGVNAAFIEGFSGGTLGVSSQQLKPLIRQVQQKTF